MKLRILVVPVLFATSSASICAGDFYVLGAAGRSEYKLDRDEFDNALRRAGALGLSSTTDRTDNAFKIQFGYRFNPNFAVEAGYVDLGKAKYEATFLGGVADASIKAHGPNLAVLGILPLGESFSIFAKLGAINATAETSLKTSRFSASLDSTHLRANDGIGLTYDFGKGIGARLEYERFHKLGDTHGGTQRVELWSLGLAIKF